MGEWTLPRRADNLLELEITLLNFFILQMWKLNLKRPNDLPRP